MSILYHTKNGRSLGRFLKACCEGIHGLICAKRSPERIGKCFQVPKLQMIYGGYGSRFGKKDFQETKNKKG